MGAGVGHPNDDPQFPGEGITEDVRAVFVDGGLHFPLRQHLIFFAGFRPMLVGEVQGEGLVGAAPLRAGLAWRF